MPDYNYLALERHGATLVCTINNPPKNFLTAPIVQELRAMVAEVDADRDLRALVITGGVEGIFSTHYDVAELVQVAAAARANESIGAGPEFHPMNRLTLSLQHLRIPTIAAINGTAMGGGCELTLGCDFRIKSSEGMYGLPESRVGLLPGAGGTQRMARLIGVAKAMELILLGNTVDGATAERIGLVHRTVPPDRVLPEALALAEEMGKRPPLSIELIKQCLYQGVEMPLEDALRFESAAFWKTIRTEDADRLMRTYLESDRPLDEQ